MSVQPEEDEDEAEASESEEKEVIELDPKPEPATRKQPQVRPWDIGKEGVKEGELLAFFLSIAYLNCYIYLIYLLRYITI